MDLSTIDFSKLLLPGIFLLLAIALIVVARKRHESPGQLLRDIGTEVGHSWHSWEPPKPAPPAPSAPLAPGSIVVVTGPDPVKVGPGLASVSVPASTVAAADPSGTVVAPAPITVGDTPVRNPFVIGPQVVAWALRQSDNFDVQTSAGAHPEIGIEGCDAITNFLCANPSYTLDAVGFEAAYQQTKAPPVAAHPSDPLPLTPAVQAKLVTYTTKCLRDCDRIGYLKLPGNSDLFDYMTTNGLFSASWFVAADYATTSGTYDPVSKTQVTSPRVWE